MRLINFNSNITIYLAEPRWDSCALNMVRKVLLVCNLRGHGISLNLSNDKQIKYFNNRWKGKNRPTNVLSFPNLKTSADPSFQKNYLGDIILSYQTLKKESKDGKLLFINHMAHLLTHGILHLKGFTHENRSREKTMQKEEINILKRLNISNPYINYRLI